MQRAELVKTLELIKPALATNNMVPIFQCFNFNGNSVSAYDDTIAIMGPTEETVEFAIHGNTLLGLLNNSRAEEVNIGFTDSCNITLGKTVSKFPFMDKTDFIFTPPEGKFPNKLNFTEGVANALKTCLETTSSDTTQAGLLGISIVGDFLYSCNGDSLTRFKLKQGIKGRVLMSTPFCSAVLKLWSTLNMTSGMLYFNDEWVHAYFGDWSVYGRILEVQDPINFETLIKNNLKGQTPVQPIPDDMDEALSRARVLSDPESQKTVLTVSKGKLKMLTETHMGEIKDELSLKDHPDVIANVNASHLQRAIRHCDHFSILERCVLLEKTPDVLMLVSNMN